MQKYCPSSRVYCVLICLKTLDHAHDLSLRLYFAGLIDFVAVTSMDDV